MPPIGPLQSQSSIAVRVPLNQRYAGSVSVSFIEQNAKFKMHCQDVITLVALDVIQSQPWPINVWTGSVVVSLFVSKFAVAYQVKGRFGSFSVVGPGVKNESSVSLQGSYNEWRSVSLYLHSWSCFPACTMRFSRTFSDVRITANGTTSLSQRKWASGERKRDSGG